MFVRCFSRLRVVLNFWGVTSMNQILFKNSKPLQSHMSASILPSRLGSSPPCANRRRGVIYQVESVDLSRFSTSTQASFLSFSSSPVVISLALHLLQCRMQGEPPRPPTAKAELEPSPVRRQHCPTRFTLLLASLGSHHSGRRLAPLRACLQHPLGQGILQRGAPGAPRPHRMSDLTATLPIAAGEPGPSCARRPCLLTAASARPTISQAGEPLKSARRDLL
jgi:hypothetical protein